MIAHVSSCCAAKKFVSHCFFYSSEKTLKEKLCIPLFLPSTEREREKNERKPYNDDTGNKRATITTTNEREGNQQKTMKWSKRAHTGALFVLLDFLPWDHWEIGKVRFTNRTKIPIIHSSLGYQAKQRSSVIPSMPDEFLFYLPISVKRHLFCRAGWQEWEDQEPKRFALIKLEEQTIDRLTRRIRLHICLPSVSPRRSHSSV